MAVSGADAVRRKFHTLDMLRGVAALSVVGRHLGGVWLQLLPGSHLAVDLFFALSGFVLANAYAGRLAAGMGARMFMGIRLRRLYPLYLLGAAIGIGFACIARSGRPPDAGVIDWAGAVLLSFAFVPAPFFNGFHLFPFNSPSWSLLWELVVNAVYAVVARRLSGAWLIAGLLVGAGLVILSAWQFGGLDSGSNVRNWWGGPERVGYSFLAGIAAHRLWAADRLRWLRLPPLAAALLLVAIFALRPPGSAPVYDATIALVAFPLLVLAATVEPKSRFWQGIFGQLGVASFAVYALHYPLIKFEAAAVLKLGDLSVATRWAIETAFVGLVLIAALAADRWYDKPVRAWLGRRR